MTTNQVATRARLTNEQLRNISSANDVLALYQELGQEATDLSEALGSGFEVLPTKEKARLVGVPFIIVEWHFSEGDRGEFVSLTIVTKHNEKLILNDGSSGILAQVHDLESRGIAAPVVVKKGLRASVYYFDPANPEEKSRDAVEGWDRAETFYLGV